MLPEKHRLRLQREFRLVFAGGPPNQSHHFTLWVQKGKAKVPRAGIILKSGLSKKATKRNYWRRRLREEVGKILPEIKEPFDFVLRLKSLPERGRTAKVFEEELRLIFKKAKMI